MQNQVGLVADSILPTHSSPDLSQHAAELVSPQKNNTPACANHPISYYRARPLWSMQPFPASPVQVEITTNHVADKNASNESAPPSLSSLPLELFQQISSDVSLDDQVNLSESNKKIRWLSQPSLRKLEAKIGLINAISAMPEDVRTNWFDFILKSTSNLSTAVRASLLQALSKHIEALPRVQRQQYLIRLDSHAYALPAQEKASVLGALFIADILLGNGDANSLSNRIDAQVTAGDISREPLKQAITKRVKRLSHSEQDLVLKKALSNGYPDIVRSFDIIMKDARVSLSRKLNLLTANQTIESRNRGVESMGWRDVLAGFALFTLPYVAVDDNDLVEEPESFIVPSLHFSFARGHAETVRAFAEIAQLAGFSESALVKLLSANNASGTPGFHLGIKHANAENIIKAFGRAIQTLDISAANKTKLLGAKNSYGIPAVHWAWKSENKAAITAYSEVVLNSGLPAKNMRELLAANAPLLGRIAYALANQFSGVENEGTS